MRITICWRRDTGEYSKCVIEISNKKSKKSMILDIPNREFIQDKSNREFSYKKIIHTKLWRFFYMNLSKQKHWSFFTRKSSNLLGNSFLWKSQIDNFPENTGTKQSSIFECAWKRMNFENAKKRFFFCQGI